MNYESAIYRKIQKFWDLIPFQLENPSLSTPITKFGVILLKSKTNLVTQFMLHKSNLTNLMQFNLQLTLFLCRMKIFI